MSKQRQQAWDEFWIAAGKAAVLLLVSHWMERLAFSISGASLAGLVASLCVLFAGFAVGLNSLPYLLEGCVALYAVWRHRKS